MEVDNHHVLHKKHQHHHHQHHNDEAAARPLADIEFEIRQCHTEIEGFLADVTVCNDNVRRRKYYSQVELLRLDLDEHESTGEIAHTLSELTTILNHLVKALKIVPVKRKSNWFTPIEVTLRFVGVSGLFVFFGTFVSLPILFLRAVDIARNADPFHYWSEIVKHWVVDVFLFLSGIHVETQGLQNDYFQSSCALLTFTHASNLDGFLVAGTCPLRQLAFGKKELFVVPFFSWLSLAIGGVPIDRENRDRAVMALQRSVDSAKKAKVAIAIAPEGTRSTTGQLLPFKKGPFHMWEQLKTPIVPLLLFGAYDLYPVGSWVNRTGIVTVRYLPPIIAEPHMSRDHLMKKLRRIMLVSLADCPLTVGQDISAGYWLAGVLGNIGSIALNIFSFYCLYQFCAVRQQMSVGAILSWAAGLSIAITALLYVYYVYLVDLGSKPSKTK